MGAGIVLNRTISGDLQKMLNQVISELQAVWPGRVITTSFDLHSPVNCDTNRVAQLFSNLLSNALSYGKADRPVQVSAAIRHDQFILSVSNEGEPIPASAMERLFTAFSREQVKPGHQGLGLGLYIAAEIARAHCGEINAVSTTEKTSFSFLMPPR